ncbi:universal stress protein UspA (plasmid) [Phenylobacterium zucineum HLK1]|uniref:Universal stress protein UspA n=1 Tax=Phenylobacterium zucineum (strain HLK1) TaxID=450851 RepID=B4RIE3_PHEZH|nr:universal stress protein [Phenylobacterium zucineum]ACG80118.1 universal stress protein UspA [Phenylobacterium zucineum HLK1]
MSELPSSAGAAVSARYESLVLHVASRGAAEVLSVAADLARRFHARLIGVGAERFNLPPVWDADGGFAYGQMADDLERQVTADLLLARVAFEQASAGLEAEWRPAHDEPGRAVTRAARDADLIVVAAPDRRGADGEQRPDAADLVLGSGRPVLLTPPAVIRLEARRIVVGWKDTREARRAVSDALPLLQLAEEVLVQSVCEDDGSRAAAHDDAAAVAANLRRRGVEARAEVAVTDAPPAEQLDIAAAALGADLIVTGAYGHSRRAEWAFGGVTRDLLHAPQRFVLLSH